MGSQVGSPVNSPVGSKESQSRDIQFPKMNMIPPVINSIEMGSI